MPEQPFADEEAPLAELPHEPFAEVLREPLLELQQDPFAELAPFAEPLLFAEPQVLAELEPLAEPELIAELADEPDILAFEEASMLASAFCFFFLPNIIKPP